MAHKLVGLAVGIVAVQGLNVVRVISLFYLGQWNMQVFEWAHLYVWQALIMLDVLIVWLVWVRTLPRDGRDAGAGRTVGGRPRRRRLTRRRVAATRAVRSPRFVVLTLAWLPVDVRRLVFRRAGAAVAGGAPRRSSSRGAFADLVRAVEQARRRR